MEPSASSIKKLFISNRAGQYQLGILSTCWPPQPPHHQHSAPQLHLNPTRHIYSSIVGISIRLLVVIVTETVQQILGVNLHSKDIERQKEGWISAR